MASESRNLAAGLTRGVLVAGVLLALTWPTQSSSYAHTVAPRRVDDGRAIHAAEEYIEDRLKDPFSAKYRHVTVATSGQGLQNVCGYVYAKNGYGDYNGGARFVVGLSDGKALAEISDIDNNREAASLFDTLDLSTCTNIPLAELESEIQRMTGDEVAADTIAHNEEDKCLQDLKSGANISVSSCFSDAQKRQRQEYSRILGTEYSGTMGLH